MTRWLDNWFKGRTSAAVDRAAATLRAHAWSPALLEVLGRLAAGGHKALLVGGTVRDPLLRRRDQGRYDVATDLRPEAVTERFGRVEPIGFQHGTVLILDAGLEIECTTFRREGAYSDARRPDQVLFTSDPLADLDRRDLTVNAMAFDPVAGTLLDPHGGALDTERRVLRAVGDPLARFREDALRPIRVARLAATLEMEPDASLEDALRAARVPENGVRLAALAAERVGDELTRLMTAPRPSVGIELLRVSGALEQWMPELARCVGVPQNRFHAYDVYFHSLYTCDAAPADKPVVRWAALLHDIGKPDTRAVKDGEGTFYEHQIVGAELADHLLERLRLPMALREPVVHLIREHMFDYRPEWTDGAVRRWLRRVGADHVADLFDLRIADALGNGLRGFPRNLEAMRRRIARVLSQSRALTLSDLSVDGHDVMQALEIGPGRAVGESLERLLQEVLDRPELNTRQQLLARLHEWRAERGLKS